MLIQKLTILLTAIGIVICFASHADASLLVKPPLYIGLNSGLKGSWSFDQTSSAANSIYRTYYDGSGAGLNVTTGTATGSSIVSGKIGQGVNFDGSTQTIYGGNSSTLDNLSPLSVSAWIKPKSDGSGIVAMIVGRANASAGYWVLRMKATHVLEFVAGFGTNEYTHTSSNNALTIGQWQHVLVTWDGSATAANAHLYVNGVEVSYQTSVDGTGGRVTDVGGNLAIGSNNGTGFFYDGQVDDVRIYNRLLSTQEIKRLYNIGGTLHVGASQNQRLTNGLVGLWSFDQPDLAGTVAYDRSGNSNNGTLTNGPTRTIGKIGQGMNFDGVNDDVDVGSPTSLDALTTVTISAWVYPTKLFNTNSTMIYSKDDTGTSGIDYMKFWLDSGTSNSGLGFYREYSTASDLNVVSADNAYRLNQWNHVVVVWDGSATAANVKFYANGVLIGHQLDQNGSGSVSNDSAHPAAIGAKTTDTDDNFKGTIDDVHVYNRALSAQEVKRLYNMGGTLHVGASQNQKLTNGLVGLWSFDQPDLAGVIAYDRSGQGNNGTLTNGPTKTIGKIGQGIELKSNYINITDPSSGVLDFVDTADFSVSGWFYWTNDGGNIQTLLAKKNGYSDVDVGYILYFDSGGALFFRTADGTDTYELLSATNFTSPSGWHHVTVVWDENSAANTKMYIDGVDNNATPTGTIGNVGGLSSASPLRFGLDSDGDDGVDATTRLDEVRIYNRVLSAQEVKRLYSVGHTGP